MSDDAHTHTRSAYRATSNRYRRRWATNDPLVDAKRRFTALLKPGATILDVGCGPGRDLTWFAQAGMRPIGLDPVYEMVTAVPHGPEVIVGDVRHIPLAEDSIDAWWASASLLHLTADEFPSALCELARVCRPTALGFLAVKQGDGEEFEDIEDGRYRRYFRYWQPNDLDRALDLAGFEITEATTVNDSLGRRPWLHRTVLHLTANSTTQVTK